MRFYRNAYRTEGGNSAGYFWFTSKREATKAAREIDQTADCEEDRCLHVAEPIDIQPTKEGLLQALNRYAEHPDNG